MTQYNFTTNIEKRMPTTGEVYFVDRMTSDYAVQHPFDVDAFIESVFQKWQDCETIGFRETRETLRRQWDATLGCRNPRGNAALYPNKNGEKHPALIEVWLKAGDYWRRGLRLGDVLPAVVPPCKITRTEEGWIALFPKDMHLLENEELRRFSSAAQRGKPMKNEEGLARRPEMESQFATAQRPEDNTPAKSEAEVETKVEAEAPAITEAADPTPTPPLEWEGNGCVSRPCQHRDQEQERQRREEELQALAEHELQRQLHRSHDIAPESNQHPTDEPAQPATARRNRRAVAARPLVACYQRDARNSSFFILNSSFLKPFALAAASVAACIVIYETGLLIPMGLIGLATSGLVK